MGSTITASNLLYVRQYFLYNVYRISICKRHLVTLGCAGYRLLS